MVHILTFLKYVLNGNWGDINYLAVFTTRCS